MVDPKLAAITTVRYVIRYDGDNHILKSPWSSSGYPSDSEYRFWTAICDKQIETSRAHDPDFIDALCSSCKNVMGSDTQAQYLEGQTIHG